jgi:hypothetical protein
MHQTAKERTGGEYGRFAGKFSAVIGAYRTHFAAICDDFRSAGLYDFEPVNLREVLLREALVGIFIGLGSG